jgi:FkbM family methyltransferase
MGLRRRRWFGLKRHVKRFLSLPVPHALLRLAATLVPSLRRNGRLPAPARLAEVEGHVGGATFVMLDPARCENAKQLYWGRGRRPRPDDRLALDAVAVLARRADAFLDVGAYTGLFTLAVAAFAPDVRAHAFEIVPAVADTLEANVARNGLGRRVTVHRQGIGEDGVTIRIPSGEGGSALPSSSSSRTRSDDGVLASFRSLDSVSSLLRRGEAVVMKVDVEGTEDAVFRWGKAFLRDFRPDILCDVMPDADAAALEELLLPARLRTYLVTNSALVAHQHLSPSPDHRDWLFTRRDPEELAALGLPVR